MAALSRVDSSGKDLPPFYLILTNFRISPPTLFPRFFLKPVNTGSLNIAHQFIAHFKIILKTRYSATSVQWEYFVGADDAEFLEKQFAPVFTAHDLMNIENRNAYVKMLVNGVPVKPFTVAMTPKPIGNMEQIEKLKELSSLKYGRPREEVETEIMEKFKSLKKPASSTIPSITPNTPTS